MIALEGGCRVAGLKEGKFLQEGALRIWQHFEGALSLRVLELDGEATLRNTKSRGSCIFLPRGQRHCVENTGAGELRLLGIFYPAGSPAVRYPA